MASVIFVLGVAMPLIIAEFRLTPDVVGLIGASLVFGAVFGCRTRRANGRSSWPKEVDARRHDDHRHRRRDQRAGQWIPNVVCRAASRWRGVGIDFPASSSYVSEVLPKRSRARMMVATIACQSVGMLLAAADCTCAVKKCAERPDLAGFSGDGRRYCASLFFARAFRNRTVRTG